ncbi:helix-turn-helix domain-containing protein [Streptomyces cheonanensis]|uniref:Helix-turn-helix domain-containing protein n=1 Tax=Streptomyces cheonanensis TaxID=312720 RepID=A0ABP5GM78_9ACTN
MLPSTVLDSDHLEPGERFDYWHHALSTVIAPMEITSDRTTDFAGRMRLIALEDIHVFPVTMRAVAARRTPRLIRQSDPELLHLALLAPGANPLAVSQNTVRDVTGPGQLYLVDTSRPFTVRATSPGLPLSGHCVEIPKRRLRLPPRTPVGRILGRALSGTRGFGGLLAHHLSHLAAQHHTYRSSDAPQLATIVSDLVTGVITQSLDAGPPPDPDSAERLLLLTIKAFIEKNLADPGMKPTDIATHHHISTRHLHRLFQRTGTTPATYIRRRRLEQAHQDLTAPAHARTPIHTIAHRWGFTSHAHFTRTYTQHYGTTPTRTRRVLDQERQAS